MTAVYLFHAYWLVCLCIHAVGANPDNCSTNARVAPRIGKRLAVSIIANVTAKTIQFCASICFRRSACRSFNYDLNASKFQCQLNEFDQENDTEDNPAFLYSSIYDWNPIMVYSCANHSCSENSICVPSVSTLSQSYTCLQLYIQCRSPRFVEYTNKIEFNNTKPYNSEINYSCKPGYKYINGSTKSICQLNMTWSKPSIKCSKVYCGFPRNVTNLNLFNHSGIHYGSKAFYVCAQGFRSVQQGGDYSYCHANGSWTKPNINCTEINCNFPRNSSSVRLLTISNGTAVGSVAIYSCVENKIFKTDSNFSVCTIHGNWSNLVECGSCSNNQNITYRGRKVCYSKIDFKHTYPKSIKKTFLVASEKSVVRFYAVKAVEYNTPIFAGFMIGQKEIVSIDGQTYPIGHLYTGSCKIGICAFNESGILTELISPSLEALSFSYYIPI